MSRRGRSARPPCLAVITSLCYKPADDIMDAEFDGEIMVPLVCTIGNIKLDDQFFLSACNHILLLVIII